MVHFSFPPRRKHDAMNPHNLFSLLSDRLTLHSSELTMPIYNVLFEVSIAGIRYIKTYIQ